MPIRRSEERILTRYAEAGALTSAMAVPAFSLARSASLIEPWS